MGPRQKAFALAALLFLLPTLALAGEPGWIEVKSRNFSVKTNAGGKKGREIAVRFEQMRKVFTSLLLREHLNLSVPLQVVVFRDAAGLRQVAPLYQGKPVELAGLFLPGDDRNYIAIDGSVEPGWETVFHEYSHLLLNVNLPATPQWFEEGFAEFFTTVRFDKAGMRIGEPPEGALRILQGGLMPVEKLFAVQRESRDYNVGDRRTLFYAESWLLMKYQLDQKKMAETGKFLGLVQNEKLPFAEAAQQAFGMSLAELDAALKRFLDQGAGAVVTQPAPEVTDPTLFETHKLKSDDALIIVADMHLHSTDHLEQAGTEYQQVLARYPMDADANRGMGLYWIAKSQPDKAAECFRRAANADSTDARVYYYNAYFTFNRAKSNPSEPADLLEMNESLDRAIALDPTYADAFSLKAWVLARSHNYTESVRVLRAAVRLSPRNDQFKANLATQLMYNRQYDESMALWDRLRESRDPAVAEQATKTLARMKELKEHNLLQVAVENEVDITAPEPNGKPDAVTIDSDDESDDLAQQQKTPKADTRPVRFVKGTLQSVDCSAKPGATFTFLTAAGKKLTLKVKDTNAVALIGTEKFDCGWRQAKAIVNYRESGPGAGDVVSVELK